MKPKFFDDTSSLAGRVIARISKRESKNNGDWHDGEVLTPHGIVTVYAQGDAQYQPSSRLDFVHAGRLHMRHFRVRLTPRGLARAARKFAAEVAG